MVDNTHQEIDAATGTATTGHEWDGIKELNTPLPKWWLYLLYTTMIWAFGYWFLYPAIPLLGGFTPGVARLVVARRGDRGRAGPGGAARTLRRPAEQARRLRRSTQTRNWRNSPAPMADRLSATIARPATARAARASKGYPNLTGDRWLWGGTLDQISATITHGARFGDSAGHEGDMPAWGKKGC